MKAETDKATSLWPHSLEVVDREADAVCNRYLFCQIRTPPSHLSWDPPLSQPCWWKAGRSYWEKRKWVLKSPATTVDDYRGFRGCWMSPDLRLGFGVVFRLLDELVCVYKREPPFHQRLLQAVSMLALWRSKEPLQLGLVSMHYWPNQNHAWAMVKLEHLGRWLPASTWGKTFALFLHQPLVSFISKAIV